MTDPRQFENRAREFRTALRALEGSSDANLSLAADTLHGRRMWPDFPTREDAAEICLRKIDRSIEDVMRTFDRLLESIGVPPRYRIYFMLMDLSDEDQETMVRILSKYV